MPTLALIPIIIFGLIYCKFNHISKFRVYLHSPQQYIFDVLFKGFGFLMVSVFFYFIYQKGFLALWTWDSLPNFISEIYSNFSKTQSGSGTVDAKDFSRDVIGITIIGSIISFLLAKLGNLWNVFWSNLQYTKESNGENTNSVIEENNHEEIDKSESETLFALLRATKEDFIKTQLILSSINKTLVFIDLDNGKVYVGRVCGISRPDGNTNFNTYKIFPTKSGYRNEKKEVVFTTFYNEQFKLATTIKGDKIISVKDFSEIEYLKFSKPNISKQSRPLKPRKKKND